MKPEEILEKATAGELSGEKLTEAVSGLSVEDQAELQRLSKESAEKSLGEATALRKERDRANELKTQAEKDAEEAAKKAEEAAEAARQAQAGGGQQSPKGDETMTNFRKEQVDKAKARFRNEHPDMNDEQFNEVFSHFERFDSGKVDADNIYSELRGAYAYVNRDTVLSAAEEKAKREREAAEAEEEAAAGAQGGDPTGSQPPKYSEETKKLAKEAGISEEAAAKVESEGNVRQYG